MTTAQFLLLSEEGRPLEEPRMLGTNELEVFTAPSDWPSARILSTSEDHDRYQRDMNDVNTLVVDGEVVVGFDKARIDALRSGMGRPRP